MLEDERCCGTGTCLINADGQCWCGQRWDGQKMCFAGQGASLTAVDAPVAPLQPAQIEQAAPGSHPDFSGQASRPAQSG